MGQSEEVPFTANDIKLAFDPSARFQPQPVYQDKPFTIAFVLHWLLFFGLFIFACVYYSTLPSNVNLNEVDAWQQFILQLTAGDIFGSLGVLAGCAVVGGVFSVFYLWLMKRFPRFMITLSLFACCLICVAVGGLFIIIGATVDDGIPAMIVGGVFVGLGLILGLCYFFWRKKIPFTVLVLSTVMHILDYQSGNFLVAIGAVVLYFVWFILWAAACIVAQSFSYMNEVVASVILTYFLFCFIWTTEVIKNVVHVTVSGAVASWYFKSDADGAQATKNALVRATTTSFGSICFGSLLVAIVTTLRAIAESKSSSGDSIIVVILRCILKCILICIESLLRLFNKYVFVQVAVYGKSYIQAAKSTWTLISYYGIETIINDTLIGNVTGLGILAGTMITLIPAIGFPFIFDGTDPTLVFLQFFLGLLVGIGIVSVCLNVVDSACAAFFVCLCEEPATLQRNFPELHAYMQQTYAQSNLFTVVHM